jgi:23S rRNA pseudouridine1911/1915/1917 synthase
MTPSTSHDQFPPILYQDDDLMVIDKPAGLVVQMSHTHQLLTLEEMLPEQPDLVRRGLVHRLDRETSGVMVLAKTLQAQQNIQQQFKTRAVKKEYQALVWGRVADAQARIDAPIARHPKLGYKFAVQQEGRQAVTEFWREAVYRYQDQYVTQLRVAIYTGRTHQIRVHLAALGHPIVGDIIYGRRKDPRLVRQCLHAARLVLHHPRTGETLDIAAPRPDDIDQFVATCLRPIQV